MHYNSGQTLWLHAELFLLSDIFLANPNCGSKSTFEFANVMVLFIFHWIFLHLQLDYKVPSKSKRTEPTSFQVSTLDHAFFHACLFHPNSFFFFEQVQDLVE